MVLEIGMEGPKDEFEVKHDARPRTTRPTWWREAPSGQRDGGRTEMRVSACETQRMLRVLHGRWPYRRSHCRHDLHWLVQVQSHRTSCPSWRRHSQAGLRAYSRRP